MLPAGWGRDVALLAALCLAGAALGGLAGHPGLGMGIGALAFLAGSLRRVERLHRWLGEGVLNAAPPVHDGMLGDIADRVRHEQARLQRELEQRTRTIERLRESYSALRDGIVILGSDNTIEWFNRSARELLGLRHPDDVGRQLVNLVRDPDFAQFLGGGAPGADFEFTRSPPHGPVLQVQSASFGESSKVLFVRDVTSLRRLETMRRDFVANISHELRTPLTVIRGYIETLTSLLPGDHSATARAITQMREQAARMESLLRDLLLLARLEGGAESRAERVDVAALLEGVREGALASCGGTRHVELRCEAGLVLLADRLQLESVAANLVFNAVRYTEPGGHVWIEFRREGGELLLAVRDDGIGIDAVHLPRLTERFYRVDKSRSVTGGGTGLGLSIVKHALNRLGGRLEIVSRLGAGSTFSCRLPAHLVADA